MLKRIKKTKLDLTTISGVACCILLNIYKEQLKDIRSVESLRIDFNSNIFTGKYVDHMNNGDELVIKLVGITKNVSILISAFNYLKDKDLLKFDKSRPLGFESSFHNFYLTANGVDIIENAKNNPLRRKDFAKTFNLSFSLNIDSMLKADNVVGVGGVASAKLDVFNKK